jgi:hypothetical protein
MFWLGVFLTFAFCINVKVLQNILHLPFDRAFWMTLSILWQEWG